MELTTNFGVLDGIVTASYYADGSIKDCILDQKNIVFTECGALIPQYGADNLRRKYIQSISFHPNGNLKCISVEKQTEIMTPIGEFPAELITFYDSGELKRIFPLNGKISGFWSEEEEAKLNIPFSFDFGFGEFSAMLIGLCFYKSGDIKSLTLFPGEIITVSTKVGEITVRNGFSLYESGKLKSVEPEKSIKVKTPIGVFNAYDVNALGINADSNSLTFSENGEILSLITSSDKIAVYAKTGAVKLITPLEKPSPLDEDEIAIIPIKLDFSNDTVMITTDVTQTFTISECTFSVIGGKLSCSSGCSDCSSCGSCKS